MIKSKEKSIAYLKAITRSIRDYPKPGIVFRDLTTIFQDDEAMALSLKMLSSFLKDKQGESIEFNKMVGIEARGFVLAGALVGYLGGGVVLARKPGKLPYEKERVNYKLEYGEDALEMHTDSIRPGDKVIIIDDLLATGGTAQAACKLVETLGGEIVKILFLVELPELEGRKKLKGHSIESVIEFEGS